MFNLSPNDKILVDIKFKACADNKLNVAEMTISLFDRVEIENAIGKAENACSKNLTHL